MAQTRVERKIQELKDCGQSIIDNAEKIISTYDRTTDIYLSIQVHPGPMRVTVTTEYVPEKRQTANVPG